MSKGTEPEPTDSKFSMETLNSAVQTLAIVLAGAWGVYTFIYEARIKPGLAPPSVSVTSTLEKVGQRGDLVAIRSTVTRTNVGRTEVRVLGLTYNIVGVRMRFAEAPAPRAVPGDLSGSSTITEARDYDEPDSGEVVRVCTSRRPRRGRRLRRRGDYHVGPGDRPVAAGLLDRGAVKGLAGAGDVGGFLLREI